MSDSVTVPGKALAKLERERAFTEARRYAKKSRAKSTWRAYENDWAQFEAWCQGVALDALPAAPDTVAMFVASQAAGVLICTES